MGLSTQGNSSPRLQRANPRLRNADWLGGAGHRQEWQEDHEGTGTIWGAYVLLIFGRGTIVPSFVESSLRATALEFIPLRMSSPTHNTTKPNYRSVHQYELLCCVGTRPDWGDSELPLLPSANESTRKV